MNIKRLASYVRLVEMGFPPELAETAVPQVMRVNGYSLADASNVTRGSRVVNDALDLLLVWGCIPEVQEMRIRLAVWHWEAGVGEEGGASDRTMLRQVVCPCFVLAAKRNYSVEFLLHRLEEVMPGIVGRSDVQLSFCGRPMDPNRTLGDYGIDHGRTIAVCIGREGVTAPGGDGSTAAAAGGLRRTGSRSGDMGPAAAAAILASDAPPPPTPRRQQQQEQTPTSTPLSVRSFSSGKLRRSSSQREREKVSSSGR